MNLNSLHFPYISKAIALYFEPHLVILNLFHFPQKPKNIALHLEPKLVILNSLHFLQKSKAIALYLESKFSDFELTSVSINIKGYSLIFGVKF